MHRSLRWPLSLLALAVLSACNNTAAPTATDAATAPVTATATAAPATPETAAAAQTQAPSGQLVLTMDKVTAYFKAQQAIGLAATSDPSLGDLAMNVSQEDSAQYAARLEANAKVRSIIAEAGLTTREFSFTGETLIAALMAQGALEAGQLDAIPDGIDAASIEFVKQHQGEIESLMESMQAAGGD